MAAAQSSGPQALDADQGTGVVAHEDASSHLAVQPPAHDHAHSADAARGTGRANHDLHVTQDGASAAGDHSLSPGSTGREPSSSTSIPAQPSDPSGLAPAVMASAPNDPEKHQADDGEARDKDKEKGSVLVTKFTTTAGKRRRDTQAASEGAHTASSTTELPPSLRSPGDTRSSAKRPKVSFFVRLARICVPCLHHSGRHHGIDPEEGATQSYEDKNQTDSPQQTTPESSTSHTVVPAVPSLALVVPLSEDADVIVPPTPTTQLLPRSETDGLTSGAVQPPGSTGVDTSHEHRRSFIRDSSGDESDASSTEDEVLRELIEVDDVDDDEQRLIKKGGAGIPIGPDGTPQPLLPPIAPRHIGRKCLVLDLDETLVHSSLKPVPSPDYIVPVEIESFWHNFYVLKRPGVDIFLKKMGEIFEVVVFTASLSKYADPVLDRLDPDHAVAHRLFRESCYNHRGNYVKDLSQLGRPIADTIIIDNSPASYIFHPNNAVPISSWFNDPHDTELTDLCPFLADLGTLAADVRGILNPAV